MIEEQTDPFLDWYSRNDILYEMIKEMRGREVAFLRPLDVEDKMHVRGVKAHAIDYLHKNFKAFQFMKRKYNIYISCALLRDMPMFSFNYKTRKKELFDFRTTFTDHFIDYDLLLDFDSKEVTFEKCLEDTRSVKKIFDDFKVPYYLLFSGSGFHLKVPGKYLPNLDGKDKTELCKLISMKLFAIGFSSLDCSVYDTRRVSKIAYSIDNRTMNICMPLRNDQIEKFNIEEYSLTNCMKETYYNRGLILRWKDSNCDSFLDNFGIGR